MTERLIEAALRLTFEASNLAALKETQQYIYKGLHRALHDEQVRTMLLLIAKDNGVLCRRAINNYVKEYIRLMGGDVKAAVKNSAAGD
jgi:hypothetical protein